MPSININNRQAYTAQIAFYETEPLNEKVSDYVKKGGKYQTSTSLEEVKKNWKPEDMLPKMYLDREVTGK